MEDQSLANTFLIAMPSLNDPNFAKAVVYIYEHSDEGSMGFIINKPMQITLGEVLSHLDIEASAADTNSHAVLVGGPIGQENGFVIHEDPTAPTKQPEAMVSSSKEVLRTIAEGNGPEKYIVTLGYSGWQPDQLSFELCHNDWLIAPYDPTILFDTPIEQRWQKAAQLIGVDINHLSGQVGHG